MKTVLIQPPFCDPTCPPLGLAYLAAALKSQNHDLLLAELNLDFWGFVESSQLQKLCRRQIDRNLKNNISTPEDLVQYFRGFLAIAKQKSLDFDVALLGHIPQTVERDYKYHIQTLSAKLNIVSLAYPLTELSTSHLTVTNGWQNLKQLILQAKNQKNLFSIWARKSLAIQSLIEFKPDWIGISVSFEDQLLPALTIANYIRQHLKTTIVFGGGLINSFGKYIGENTPFWSIIDGVVLGAGELAVDLLQKQKDGYKVYPTGMHRSLSNDKWILDVTSHIKEPPEPDFEAFPLDQYRSVGRVLPYRIFPKCSWGKCAFCADQKYCFHLPLDQGDTIQIAENIQNLIKKYRASGIYFLDAELPTAFMLNLGREFCQRKLNIRWGSNTRFSAMLSQHENADILFDSGCRLLRFGIESASPRILKAMNKGISVINASKVLKNISEKGITTHVYLMKGFPGETEEDWEKTIDFLLANAEYIDMFNVSPFTLYEDSPLYDSLKKENTIALTPSECKWQYPQAKFHLTVVPQAIRDIQEKFFLSRKYTKNCTYTSDTLLLADKMVSGISFEPFVLPPIKFCSKCKVAARPHHLWIFPFDLKNVGNALNNREFTESLIQRRRPSCLIMTAFSRYWQAPYSWRQIKKENFVKDIMALMGGISCVSWGIQHSFLRLIECDSDHSNLKYVPSKQPRTLKSISIPVGLHFDGHYEDPEQ